MRGDFFKRVLVPAMIPLGAFVFIGALVFGFSRILLAVPKDGSVVVAVLMAGCVLFAAGAVAKGGKVKLPQRFALIGFALLLLVGGTATGLSIGTRPIKGHAEVAAKIAAQNIKFDKAEIDLPAEAPFIIEFDNKDPVPHNVAIYDKQPTTPGFKTFFQPPLTPGPKVIEFEVTKPIPTGVWYFQCDAHTTMHGIARVGGAKGPGPGGSPGPAPSVPPSSPSPQPSLGAGTVDMTDALKFDPATLTIKASEAVTWLNVGSLPHTVTSDDGTTFDSGADASKYIGANGKFEFTFTKPGRYSYYCRLHGAPGGAGMSGVIIVE